MIISLFRNRRFLFFSKSADPIPKNRENGKNLRLKTKINIMFELLTFHN